MGVFECDAGFRFPMAACFKATENRKPPRARQMASEGADIVDIGGGIDPPRAPVAVSAVEELARPRAGF